MTSEDEAFRAWRDTFPEKHWSKTDLGACRLGWDAGRDALRSTPTPDARCEVGDPSAGRLPRSDRRYPHTFYDADDGDSRIKVAEYVGEDRVTFGVMRTESRGLWWEIRLTPADAAQFALHILEGPLACLELNALATGGVVKAEPVAVTNEMVERALSIWPRSGTPYGAADIMRAALTAALAFNPEGDR